MIPVVINVGSNADFGLRLVKHRPDCVIGDCFLSRIGCQRKPIHKAILGAYGKTLT